MTDTSNPATQPSLPENSAAADKILRKRVMIFTVVVLLMLFSATLIAPYITVVLLRKSPQSMVALVVDLISAGFIMAVFFYGSSRLATSLTDYGRNFVERGQWEDAEYVLSSFNNWGQHFLDGSGEAHYLLSIALAKRGKNETARKVRAFIVKSRSQSEWAQKVVEQEKGRAAPTQSRRSEDNSPKPSKTKRRRY